MAMEKKIATKVAYGPQENDGPPVAWGENCDALPAAHVKECFKSWIGATNFSRTPNTLPGDPESQAELHRWVRDYLHAFCAEVIFAIDNAPNSRPNWRDGSVIWNFTVPGSWAKFPVVADFKRLAEEAVTPYFQRNTTLRICSESTEASASAQYLLEEASSAKDQRYVLGNLVISCDIGGATIDVASSTISGPGQLASWPQTRSTPGGTVTIQKAFWDAAHSTLQKAGAQIPDQMALKMARGEEFLRRIAEFTIGDDDSAIVIPLPSDCQIQESPCLEAPTRSKSTVQRGKLLIHR
jgi:hypothetical protein